MKQWPTVYCEKAAITIIQQGSGWSVAMALLFLHIKFYVTIFSFCGILSFENLYFGDSRDKTCLTPCRASTFLQLLQAGLVNSLLQFIAPK